MSRMCAMLLRHAVFVFHFHSVVDIGFRFVFILITEFKVQHVCGGRTSRGRIVCKMENISCEFHLLSFAND